MIIEKPKRGILAMLEAGRSDASCSAQRVERSYVR